MEFPSDLQGHKIVCPHCNTLTTLGLPQQSRPSQAPQTIYVEKTRSFGCLGVLGLVIVMICIVAYIASSLDSGSRENTARPASPISPEESAQLADEIQKDLQKEKARASQYQNAGWMPQDGWRLYAGETNFAAGSGWVQFVGEVIEVQPHGVRIRGLYGTPGAVSYNPDYYNNKTFFVQDFPYSVAEGDTISERANYTALDAGTYTYATVLGGTSTIHRLEYGTVCDTPQPSKQELETLVAAMQSQKDAATKAKQAAALRNLKWNQEQADRGDDYGLLRMGERYMTGDGVETNLLKAGEYLARSAAKGNTEAKEQLSKLNAISK